jgi:hypothetical protein
VIARLLSAATGARDSLAWAAGWSRFWIGVAWAARPRHPEPPFGPFPPGRVVVAKPGGTFVQDLDGSAAERPITIRLRCDRGTVGCTGEHRFDNGDLSQPESLGLVEADPGFCRNAQGYVLIRNDGMRGKP